MERTALNFLNHASGFTNQFVKKILYQKKHTFKLVGNNLNEILIKDNLISASNKKLLKKAIKTKIITEMEKSIN